MEDLKEGDMIEYLGLPKDTLFIHPQDLVEDCIHCIQPMDIFIFVKYIDETRIRVRTLYGYLPHNTMCQGVIRPIFHLVLKNNNNNGKAKKYLRS